MKPSLFRRSKRVLAAGIVAAVGAAGLAVMSAAPASAGQGGPSTSGTTTVTVSETAGLADGQSINITATQSGANTETAITAKISATGIAPLNGFNFGPSGPFCPQFGSTPAVNTFGGGNSEKSTGLVPATGSLTMSYQAGQGTVSWTDGSSVGHTLTCDKTNPCKLVVQVQRTSGTDYLGFDLSYAGIPNAPTAVGVVKGDSQATVSWTPPSGAGLANGALNRFIIEATGLGCAPCAKNVNGLPPANADVITGLTNFNSYSITVKARTQASDGLTFYTSLASTPAQTIIPGPAGPSGVSGSPANQSVNLTWTAPANTTGLFDYQIKVFTSGPTLFSTFNTGSSTTSYTVGSGTPAANVALTNGTPYTFTVTARYNGGTDLGQESAPGGPVTPAGKRITQTFNVTRPQGDLVLTQECAGPVPFDPYPVDAGGVPNPTYPTNCTINLPIGQLVKTGPQSGQYFQSQGAIQEVTVIDTRDSDPHWNVTAQVTPFTSATDSFSSSNLGWVPSRTYAAADPVAADGSQTFNTPDGPYTFHVTAGAAVAAGTVPGLAGSPTLASAPAGKGLGMVRLNATLNLLIPVFHDAGNYTAVMTITAI